MKIDNLALRPNCLLTKYPLVFLSGMRSLFFPEKLGGFLQDFIAAHGYVVLSPALPFRSIRRRRIYFQQWLKQQKTPQFHFVLSKKTHKEFYVLLNSYPHSTYTIIPQGIQPNSISSSSSKPKEPISYQLHKIFCWTLGSEADRYDTTLPDKSSEFYDRFLDHCIELAENDLI